ncbi:MAG: glycosyltransferase family 2 protein [Planctomycetota bacterium]|nr:glycosyltransferase family 2 protein [Planctomycetota bacterium]
MPESHAPHAAPPTPMLSIIIVSFNTRALTLEAIRSAIDNCKDPATGQELPVEFIIVDNASSDGSAEAIAQAFPAERFPNLKLIASRDNLGFAGGNNLAAKSARGAFLLLLNPDTITLDNAIGKLVDFARRRPDAGIWGGRTLFPDQRLNPASCWQRQTPWSVFCVASGLSSVFRRSSLFNPEGYGGWNRQGVREVDIVSGCFLMIRRELWDRLNGFDPMFFMYGEEADLCLRAHQLGARPVVSSEATIVHYGAASDRVRADKMVRLLKAKTLLIRRHWPPATRGLGAWMLAMWPRTRALAWSLLKLAKPERGRVAHATWNDIWTRRHEWMARQENVHQMAPTK